MPGHLAEVRSRLREEAELAREMPEDAYEADLQRRIREQLTGEGLGEETIAELLQAVPTAYQWSGLDRYWRKRAEREARLERDHRRSFVALRGSGGKKPPSYSSRSPSGSGRLDDDRAAMAASPVRRSRLACLVLQNRRHHAACRRSRRTAG